MNGTRICSVGGCNRPVKAKDLCGAHYRRNRLHGNPLLTHRPGLGLSTAERLALYTDKSGQCWIWTGGGTRYGKIQVSGRTASAHIVAYETQVGPIPAGLVVRHRCDNPKCVRPDHLELGTYADNSRDMTDRGRQAKGERQWCAKMTPEAVTEMREAYFDGISNIPQLARQYGLATSTVGKIVNFKTWKHVPFREAA